MAKEKIAKVRYRRLKKLKELTVLDYLVMPMKTFLNERGIQFPADWNVSPTSALTSPPKNKY